ncbi:MAG: hypothetical protein ACHQZS_02665 [Candidatus Binatales bacterium]
MAWTLKMRITSVAVTIYLALAEYLLVAIPAGVILWLAGANPARLISIGLELAALWALAIVLISNVRPLSIRARASDGDRT